MPSFDILSEVDQPALRNAVEQANRKVDGRHDFKGTCGTDAVAIPLKRLLQERGRRLSKASRQRASLMRLRASVTASGQRPASSGRLAVGHNSLISLRVMGLAVTSERIFHQHRPVRLLRKLPPVTSAD